MRRPVLRRATGSPNPSGWAGPRLIPVIAASGGAGASTMCALLAAAVVELAGPSEQRQVLVLDLARHPRSPWSGWIIRDLDPDLGDEGRILVGLHDETDGYPPALLRRAASAVRGLDGVAVVAALHAAGDDEPIDPTAAGADFAAVLVDVAQPGSTWLSRTDVPVVLCVDGTPDGLSAALRVLAAWRDQRLPVRRIVPVIVAPPGGLAPRARALRTLLDSYAQPSHVLAWDGAIGRRGLAEALAGTAVVAATRMAIREVARALAGLDEPPRSGAPMLLDTLATHAHRDAENQIQALTSTLERTTR